MITHLLFALLFGLKSGDKITVRAFHRWVMAQPSFIGASVGEVSRGDVLVFVEEQGLWYKVKVDSREGWIYRGDVVDKKVSFSSRIPGVEEEEKAREENPDLEWSHIDAIDRLRVTPEELEEFKKAGSE